MTKFSGENDSGYVRVRDQFWFWVDALHASDKNSGLASGHVQTQVQDTLHVVPESGVILAYIDSNIVNNKKVGKYRHQGGSSIASSGGTIFTGDVKAGRDFAYNHN
jgi:hypothetical protein